MRGAVLLGLLASCGDNAARPVDAAAGWDNELFLAPTHYAVAHSSAAAVGDVDGDGRLDIVVASSGSATVLENIHDGKFAPLTTIAMGGGWDSVALGDLDRDGRADVAVIDPGGSSIDVSIGFSAAQRFQTGPWPMGLALADLNGDGLLDLVTANNLGRSTSVLLGIGAGSFGPAQTLDLGSGTYPFDVVAADFDHDGKLDLAVADQGPLQGDSVVSILHGHGDGTFAAPSTYEVGNFPQSIDAADFDGDGNVDLVVGNWGSDFTSVLHGNGDGTFAPQQKLAGRANSVKAADLDGDGRAEILAAQGCATIYRNAGDGTFTSTTILPDSNCGRLAIGDLNGDGKPDLVGVDMSFSGAAVIDGSGITVFLHR